MSSNRRVDLDWIRIVAFAILILYHVGMYYASWDYHVKSPYAGHAIEPLMMFFNPWRLALLFVVSGAATAFMAARMAPGALADSRSLRLIPPFVFGVLVVVAPQSWFEVRDKLGYSGSFAEFWLLYLTADESFCKGAKCLVIPTWNQLWFVFYLWVYTMAIVTLLAVAPSWRERLAAALERRLTGWGVLLWPWLMLAAARLLLVGWFPSTLAFIDDWYNHALFFTAFAIGFLVARAERVWQSMERIRWPALGLALAAYAFLMWYYFLRPYPENPTLALRMFQRAVYALDQWAFIVALCGFARRHIRKDGPARRYLTEAIFPFYIAHQTALIAFAVWMRPLGLHPVLEAALLIAATAAACLATYEVAKRVAWLRPLFGLKT